ncbi:MAG: hypothetical protein EZS28_017615 [Streblomastix strix]|uniref:Right handed beta helix domain-containing protein n=1 Tax=Streblomastix strix TaxID=222440 RepID=A0A5J4VXF9_9EUKA|nr:MAG: hypothetical protein EZS28_017615 [Streblomastix strix]
MTLRNTTFSNCNSSQGGAVWVNLAFGGRLTIDGLCSFTDCQSLNQSGGAVYASVNWQNSQFIMEDGIQFSDCICISNETNSGGGALYAYMQGGELIMRGSCIFRNCNSSNDGGAFNIMTDYNNDNIRSSGGVQFIGCNSGSWGGGILISSSYTGLIQINKMSFQDCSSLKGGGFYSSLYNGASLLITGKLSFLNCSSSENQDDGGGIYLWIANSQSCISQYEAGGCRLI